MNVVKVLGAAVLLPLLLSVATAAPQNVSVLSELDTYLSAIYVEKAPGAAVLAVQHDKIVIEKSYGLADVDEEIPITSNMVFRIGSLTKQFTAAAILKLVERNQIGLSDPIENHLAVTVENDDIITIEHLLTHTSGIADFENLEKTMMDNAGQKMEISDVIRFFADRAPQFEPGTNYHYSNSGYILLGAIIENVTGRSYQEFLKAEIFAPLQMRATYFDHRSFGKPRMVRGYHRDGDEIVNAFDFNEDIPYSAGGLLSTMGDLLLWNNALWNGDVVSEPLFEKMILPYQLTGGEMTEYGYGIEVLEHGSQPLIAHQGGIFGFQSYLATLPDDGIQVIILTNTDNPVNWPNQVADKLIEIIRR